jgi:hypothetical protein
MSSPLGKLCPPPWENIGKLKIKRGGALSPLVRLPHASTSPFDLENGWQLIPTHQSKTLTLELCPPPWDAHSCTCFDTCKRSKRGNFIFPSINKGPLTLISHLSSMYCYYTQISPTLLSLPYCSLSFLKLVASICSSLLIIEESLEETISNGSLLDACLWILLEVTCVIVFFEFLASRFRVGDLSKVLCLDRSIVVLLWILV